MQVPSRHPPEPRQQPDHWRGSAAALAQDASGRITGATAPLHWLRRLTAPSLEYRWEP
jgi:hypothetical protein